MPYPKPPLIELDSLDSKLCGQQHGEILRQAIHEFAEIRIDLMLQETNFKTRSELFQLANEHLPVLKNFDEDLYLELIGIAEGSALNPAHIVILNQYTDMRDINPSELGHINDDTKGCSTIYSPSPDGPLLGQTWDISGSALNYVTILKIKQSNYPKASEVILFSVAGCLGMTGINSAHLGVCINNFPSVDAHVGIIWSALVRKMLKQYSATNALDVVMKAPLGSGHHYSIADLENFYGVETSGLKKKITQQGNNQIHFHTNHCLDEEMKKTHTTKSTSTTFSRYKKLADKLNSEKEIESAKKMFGLLGHVSMAVNEKNCSAVATCGAFVMDLKSNTALTCKGPPSINAFANPPHLISL